MELWLARSPWLGIVLWIILYISDYYLTVYSARGFKEIGHFQFEGSFELTPQYQKDIDALKPVSRLHIILLVLYSLLILGIWYLFVYFLGLPWAYLLYLGMFLLLEVAVHLRHFRNIFLIREIRKNGGVDGQISYRKWFSYRVSAFELYLFFGLFLIVAALASSPFFLGGAIMCFGTGLKHNRLAKKAKSNPAQLVETKA
ncbi:MAG: hypothetical protein L0287_30980 [Anaerolineae bacterium]|nr:hypothetical protein [Anaerolineae bacterium]MCI0608485.1 hypothetical protein [Anaerolineae bacterium]